MSDSFGAAFSDCGQLFNNLKPIKIFFAASAGSSSTSLWTVLPHSAWCFQGVDPLGLDWLGYQLEFLVFVGWCLGRFFLLEKLKEGNFKQLRVIFLIILP